MAGAGWFEPGKIGSKSGRQTGDRAPRCAPPGASMAENPGNKIEKYFRERVDSGATSSYFDERHEDLDQR
jgi:hypothetical protein